MKVSDNLVNSLLGEAGLSQSERSVYLAGVHSGLRTSSEIIAKTAMPRPTATAALKALCDKGLCRTHKRDGRSFVYEMLPVSALKSHVGEKMRQLDEVMNRLDEVSIEAPAPLETREAHGQKEVQDLLELALRCKTRKWYIIAPHANALRFMPKSYTDYFKRVRKERQIASQTLWDESNKKDHIPMYDLMMRKPRYIPKNFGQRIPSLLLAFDDYLLVIDGTSNPSAALIHNASSVRTFEIIFELAWRSARS